MNLLAVANVLVLRRLGIMRGVVLNKEDSID